MSYYSSIYVSMCISLIGVLSMFVLISLTGIFSMGQASFMSVGAYAAGLMCLRAGTPMLLNIIIAILLGMLVAWGVAVPVIKLRRDYIALVTLAFGEAIVALLNSATKFTGGSKGLNGIPRQTTVFIATVSLLIVLFLVLNFKRSKFGRQCLAVKSDEISAAAMGINVQAIKTLTFVFCGGLTAFGGALWAYLTTYVEPSAFATKKSIEWIIMVFIGGVNSLSGTVTAGVLLSLLPEFLRFTDNLRIVIYCIVVLIIINFMPKGLFGEYEISGLLKKAGAFFAACFKKLRAGGNGKADKEGQA
ncbi:MAG: branched-chain amino acid ABC transporter permease [Candidatus Pelethousia sp.]|nr:branched-chain amino acid ABC transporter permease [Candidatus Pelethousia sp.]